MSAKLEFVSCFRDFVQFLYANRIPFNDPIVLEIAALWNELVKSSNDNIKFGPFELGGADPQVETEYYNVDFAEIYRQVREIAPHVVLRPLWRGNNGFLLKRSHPDDLEHLLTQLAEDLADAELSPNQLSELLRIKVFDSQGRIGEVLPTIKIIKKLRDKNYPVSVEVAIPYSDDSFYSDDFYVQKFIEAAETLRAEGFVLSTCLISLKDMGGEMDSARMKSLLPRIIDELQSEGLETPLGVHLHDTGLAVDASVTAIKVSRKKDCPLTLDTVECDPVDPKATGENAWKNVGFASLLEIDRKLKESGESLGLTAEQTGKLEQIASLTAQVATEYKVRRANITLTGQELRKFHIPGGGLSSFINEISSIGEKKEGLAKLLGISDAEALQVAGHALVAVSNLMGRPFAVTPGFQNKQIAAINLLKNMLDIRLLHAGMGVERIIAILETPLNDAQVKSLLLRNLKDEVKDFLMGEMPGETVARLFGDKSVLVHRVITEELGRTGNPQNPPPSKLPQAKAIAQELLNEGRIKATVTQAKAILKKLKLDDVVIAELLVLLKDNGIIYEQPDGRHQPWREYTVKLLTVFFSDKEGEQAQKTAESIVTALEAKTLQSHTTWALMLGVPDEFKPGDPNKLRENLARHWWREPDPRQNPDDYKYALKRFQQGKNPIPDKIEQMYRHLKQGKLSLPVISKYTKILRNKERAEIRQRVLELILEKSTDKTVGELIELVYTDQQRIIREKESKGEYFVLPEKGRLDIALDCLRELANCDRKDIHKIRKELESTIITAPMPGLIKSVTAKVGPVKAGDVIVVMEAMKAETSIKASHDGNIIGIDAKKGAAVKNGDALAFYEKKVDADFSVILPDIIDIAIAKSKRSNFDKEFEQQSTALSEVEKEIQNALGISPAPVEAINDFEKYGYYGPTLTLLGWAKTEHENEIHVIGNRAGCAVKLRTDLVQAGCDVRMLYTKEDVSTPIIANMSPDKKKQIKSYMDHPEILSTLTQLARDNPGKKIWFHPGWGLLSEDAGFVEQVEQLAESGVNIAFAGPASKPMDAVGSKQGLRDVVARPGVAPELNPKYFGHHHCSVEEMRAYIESGFTSEPLNAAYRQHFADVKTMGGKVMIKASAGGGGRGIEPFTCTGNDKEDYENYIRTVYKNMEVAQNLFSNTSMVTEQRIEGVTRHLEAQLVIADDAEVIGFRDCTAQNNKQKFIETNLIKGDYDPEVIEQVLAAFRKVGIAMGASGYRGVATLEALVVDGKVTVLEANTRVQVEHMVTEEVIAQQTGARISIPLLNFLCVKYPDKSVKEIMESAFGITDAQLAPAVSPGDKRIVHLRVNSRSVDLQTGVSAPSFLFEHQWPGVEVMRQIAKETGVTIIEGGIGEGVSDPQTGAICGPYDNVMMAARACIEWMEVSQTCYRSDGTLSLPFTLAFNELMYDANGNFNPRISTKTTDELLLAIQRGQIELVFDDETPSINPQLAEGAMKSAFEKLCRLTEQPQALAGAAMVSVPS